MLDVAGRPEVVSLDCLKPAYLESDLVTDVDTSTLATSTVQPMKSPVTITRSGRPVQLKRTRMRLYVLASRLLRSLRGEYCNGCNAGSSDTRSVPSPDSI